MRSHDARPKSGTMLLREFVRTSSRLATNLFAIEPIRERIANEISLFLSFSLPERRKKEILARMD